MPGGYPFFAEVCNGTQAETATSLWGISIPSGGSANTKGAWTTIISSTPADASWIDITLMSGGNPSRCAVDIGIGASGSEQALITNLLFLPANNYYLGTKGPFPIAVPIGSRLSARYVSEYASGADSCSIQVGLYAGSFGTASVAGMDALSFDATNTAGTAIAAGNQVMGSYVQLTASTSRDYSGFYVIHDSKYRTANDQGGFDIAIGAIGSEQVIMTHVGWTSNVNDIPSGGLYPITVPAGTRMAARAYYIRAGDTSPSLSLYGLFR